MNQILVSKINKKEEKKKRKSYSIIHFASFFTLLSYETMTLFEGEWRRESGVSNILKKTVEKKKEEIIRLHANNVVIHWVNTWVTKIVVSWHFKHTYT